MNIYITDAKEYAELCLLDPVTKVDYAHDLLCEHWPDGKVNYSDDHHAYLLTTDEYSYCSRAIALANKSNALIVDLCADFGDAAVFNVIADIDKYSDGDLVHFYERLLEKLQDYFCR